MDCSEFLSIVAGEREDDLSSAESDAFEAHLEGCASCGESVARAEEDLERLVQIADPPPARAWARVDVAVREQARRRPGREQPFSPGPVLALPALELPAPAAPPPIARPALVASPASRSRTILALAAVAAAIAIILSFLAAPPLVSRDRDGEVVIHVKPLENGDVKYGEDLKVGPSFKVLKKQGRLVTIEPEGE